MATDFQRLAVCDSSAAENSLRKSSLQTVTIATLVLLKALRRAFREYLVYSRNSASAMWRVDNESGNAEADS